MKIQRAITVEAEVWENARKSFPNELSQKIEDFLKYLVNLKNVNISAISIDELRAKKAQNDAKLSEISQNNAEIMQKIRLIEEKMVEEQQKKKEKEIEEAVKKKTCYICGTTKNEEELRKLANGVICKGCLIIADTKNPKFRQLLGKNERK